MRTQDLRLAGRAEGLLDQSRPVRTGASSDRRGIEARRRSETRLRSLPGLFDAGQLCCFMGRYAEAQNATWRKVLPLRGKLATTQVIAVVCQPLGMAAIGLGDLTKARAYLEEAVALARELGKRRELAVALNALAQLHRMEGQLSVAEPLYEEVLVACARVLVIRTPSLSPFLTWPWYLSAGRRGERAQPMLLEALAISDANRLAAGGSKRARSLLPVCAPWTKLGKQAARFFGAAEAQAERAGLRRDAVG